MKDYTPEKLRNVAIIGHGSSGKTSLTSAFLFNSGMTSRLTKVGSGNTVTDYDPDEIERQISINSAVAHLDWDNHKINIIDCPGYINFLWDTRASLRAVDGGIVVVDAASGVEVGTEKVWEMLEEFGQPRLLVINKLDRENSDYKRALESIHQSFGRQAVLLQLPIGNEKDFSGVVDLIQKKAYVFEKDGSGKVKEEEIPAELRDEANQLTEQLTEMIAENDEELMEKYFDSSALSSEDLIAGLKKSILKGDLYPVFVTSALLNIGTQSILDSIVNYLPSPFEREEIKTEEGTVKASLDDPFSLWSSRRFLIPTQDAFL